MVYGGFILESIAELVNTAHQLSDVMSNTYTPVQYQYVLTDIKSNLVLPLLARPVHCPMTGFLSFVVSDLNLSTGYTREGTEHSCDCIIFATVIGSSCCCLLCIAEAVGTTLAYASSFGTQFYATTGLLCKGG